MTQLLPARRTKSKNATTTSRNGKTGTGTCVTSKKGKSNTTSVRSSKSMAQGRAPTITTTPAKELTQTRVSSQVQVIAQPVAQNRSKSLFLHCSTDLPCNPQLAEYQLFMSLTPKVCLCYAYYTRYDERKFALCEQNQILCKPQISVHESQLKQRRIKNSTLNLGTRTLPTLKWGMSAMMTIAQAFTL